LVGLNESGKTTILEALNFLTYKIENLDPLNLHGYSVKDVHELIPISKRSNFNGKILIKMGFQLDEKDKDKIYNFLDKCESVVEKTDNQELIEYCYGHYSNSNLSVCLSNLRYSFGNLFSTLE
jgi:AAA15 family ATPase/GTPase